MTKMGRRIIRAQRQELSHSCSHTHTHVICHRPEHQCVCREDDALQGDSVIRRLYYIVAPVQTGARYLPHPYLASSAPPPLINLDSDCPQDSLVLIRGGVVVGWEYVYDACTPVQTHTHTILRS